MSVTRNTDLIFLVLLSILSACAAPVRNLSRVQYTAPEFNSSLLIEEGLCLLPVVTERGQEPLRRPLAEKLEKYLGDALPERKFLRTVTAMDVINNANLTEDYAKLLENHSKTGLLNKDSLHKMNQATEVRYLLHVKLLERLRKREEKFEQELGTVTLPVYGEKGHIYIFGQVWDCKMGNIAWEGIGEVSVQPDILEHVTQTTDELEDKAVRSFLEGLLGVEIKETKPEEKNEAPEGWFGRYGMPAIGIGMGLIIVIAIASNN
jgi:hypothetical protein